MNDLDLYFTRRLHLAQALAGAALLDDAAAELLLAEVPLNDLLCSVAQAALKALRNLRDEQPVRYATEPTLDLVLEELEATGVLGRLEELGGRSAVEDLVAHRPELRRAREAVEGAVKAMAAIADEPVVQLAAVELGAADQGDHDHLEKVDASTFPWAALTRSRDSLPSTAPVTRSRHRAPSQRSKP